MSSKDNLFCAILLLCAIFLISLICLGDIFYPICIIEAITLSIAIFILSGSFSISAHQNLIQRPYTYGGDDELTEALTAQSPKPAGDEISREAALELEFPYAKLYMTEDENDAAFERIAQYSLNIVETDYYLCDMDVGPNEHKYKGRHQIIKLEDDEYLFNYLSDIYNQPSRVKCKRADESSSPLDFWRANKRQLVAKCEQTHGKISIELLADIVRNNIYGCMQFRPNLVVGFARLFGAKSMLDFSAGWGDRLIGAIAADLEYMGIDPNTELFAGYNAIIKRYATDAAKYTMINSPFENVQLDPNKKYDLVMTSPPYFDLEVYTNLPGQSIITNPTFDSWFNNFLMIALKKAWEALADGGHMVIIINDIRQKERYVMRMRDKVNKFAGAGYLGLLPYARFRDGRPISPKPVFIWEKKYS